MGSQSRAAGASWEPPKARLARPRSKSNLRPGFFLASACLRGDYCVCFSNGSRPSPSKQKESPGHPSGCVAERQRSREVCSSHPQGAASAGFQPWRPSTVRSGRGDERARDDRPRAQTVRCCIFGGLSHRHRSGRNRYIDSSKTRLDPAVTLVRGTPALGAAARHQFQAISIQTTDLD